MILCYIFPQALTTSTFKMSNYEYTLNIGTQLNVMRQYEVR